MYTVKVKNGEHICGGETSGTRDDAEIYNINLAAYYNVNLSGKCIILFYIRSFNVSRIILSPWLV